MISVTTPRSGGTWRAHYFCCAAAHRQPFSSPFSTAKARMTRTQSTLLCNYHEGIYDGFDFEEQNDKYMLYTDAQSQLLMSDGVISGPPISQLRNRLLRGGPTTFHNDLICPICGRSTVRNAQGCSQRRMGSYTGDSSNGVILDLLSKIRLAPGVQLHSQQPASLDQGGRDGTSHTEAQGSKLKTIASSASPTATKPVTQCDFSNGSVAGSPPSRAVSCSGGGNSCAAGGSGAASLRPPLLAPSFFSHQHSTVGSRSGESSGISAVIPSSASIAQTRSSPHTTASDRQRVAVRQAILELANLSEFTEMILRALHHTQAL